MKASLKREDAHFTIEEAECRSRRPPIGVRPRSRRHARSLSEQWQVLELVRRGTLRMQDPITPRFRLDRRNEAFDVTENRDGTKAIFVAMGVRSMAEFCREMTVLPVY
jgi:hypothetical protein